MWVASAATVLTINAGHARRASCDASGLTRCPEPNVERNLTQTVGFIGVGTMGEPMARNLLRAGIPLVVWNRSPAKARTLEVEGAAVATEVPDVFARAHTVMAMLATADVLDTVLGRGTATFAPLMRGHTLVQLGITSPNYSHELDVEIQAVGGRYVEAPVVGSSKPAELGTLVALLGGHIADVDLVGPLLRPMCRETVFCGAVPQAMATKLANNLLIGTMLASLAEAANYAHAKGVDLETLMSLFGHGPMGSDLLRMKAPKLLTRDFSAQASLASLLNVSGLIAGSARDSGIATPMLDTSHELFKEAATLGSLDDDVMAVIRTFEQRTRAGDCDP